MGVPGRRSSEVEEMVRGTVLVGRRRCGKPNRRCATGETAHEPTVLSYRQDAKAKLLMLPPAEVEPVRTATERFRAARARLDQQGSTGLAHLVARLRRSSRPS